MPTNLMMMVLGTRLEFRFMKTVARGVGEGERWHAEGREAEREGGREGGRGRGRQRGREGRREGGKGGVEEEKGQVHGCTGIKFNSPFNSILATIAAGLPTVWAMAVKPLGVPYIVKLMCLVSCGSSESWLLGM